MENGQPMVTSGQFWFIAKLMLVSNQPLHQERANKNGQVSDEFLGSWFLVRSIPTAAVPPNIAEHVEGPPYV